MTMKRRLTSLLTLLLITAGMAPGLSAADYLTNKSKAQRFFAHKEWASASAMCQLMLDERPNEDLIYAHGIVAEGMLGHSDAQMRYFNAAISHHIPLDQMLREVKEVSFSCGSTDLYEHFLLTVQSTHPWMSRVMDGYLLDYYSYRCDGPQMIAYSEKMLAGLPDSVRYLHMLARGYFLSDEIDKAMKIYRHIVDISPDDVDALLWLGNYCINITDLHDEGIGFLQRAYALYPTPYVSRLIS